MKTVLLLLVLYPVVLWGQAVRVTPEDLARKQSFLLMRDGSVVRGQIVRQDSSLITVKKAGGDMTFVETDQLIGIMPIRPRPTTSAPSYSVFYLKDSTRLEGRFVRRDSTMITVRKRNGQLTYFEPELLHRVDSTVVDTVPGADSGRTFSNQFSPWLLIGQTAYNPKKGQFYYRNKWVLLNEFQYGITRNWSVGVGVATPIPWLYRSAYDAYYGSGSVLNNSFQLKSKLSASIGRKFRVGLNVSYQPNTYRYSYSKRAWTFQALASIGTSQRNVTLGYGLINRGKQPVYQYWSSMYPTPYTLERIPDQSFLTLGLVQKVLPNLTLLSDNRINLGQRYYFYDDTGERATLSFALRLDRRRHSFDLGAYSLIYRNNYSWDGKNVRVIPYIGYNLLLGGKTK
ncbi:hypothetical protein [Spirosoma oryzicola]|uniref:hypothetical protein n=1 Tax=Spirosoma oryzicola TaxID=2898794 RepID=UPI001E444D9E|nr:hypothetical protein [Spirosoma oryzicola]UHG89048.1 hypothetical protein LQ777_12415 [Spirosoma oryzicola]